MEPIITTIITIGSVCSAIMALVALISLVFKKPKQWLKEWIITITRDEFNQQLKPINDSLTNLVEKLNNSEKRERAKLGHSIMTIYDRSSARGYITVADKKDLVELHQDYHDVHGNHHVDEYFEIMMDMDVK